MHNEVKKKDTMEVLTSEGYCYSMGKGRIPTGVPGLDELIEGGIPKGAMVLLIGGPGSGKTVAAAQFIYAGLKAGEHGVYVSFAEGKDTFNQNMKRMGMDFAKHETAGALSFLDLIAFKEAAIDQVFATILSEMKAVDAKRLVFDSFSVLSQSFDSRFDARILLHSILGKSLRLSGVTSIITVEKQSPDSPSGMEEFVSDGIILLTNPFDKGFMDRRLQVLKMRGTKIGRSSLRYDIGDQGLHVFPALREETVRTVSSEKVGSGIDGLDAMLSGGFFKGSTTFVAGASGSGKTVAALHFCLQGAKAGEKVLYISFEEPASQIERHATGFGWDLKPLIERGLFKVITTFPDRSTAEDDLYQVTQLIDKERPVRFVLDSLTTLGKVMAPDILDPHLRSMIAHLRASNTTSLFTIESEAILTMAGTGRSTVADNIINLQLVELGSRMRRALLVLKARGCQIDPEIREFTISSEGLKVGARFSGFEGILSGSGARRLTHEVTQTCQQESPN